MELKINDADQKRRGTNLETKLLEVKCMSKPKLFYLRLLDSVSKPTFLKCVWPGLTIQPWEQAQWPRNFVGKCAHKVHVPIQAECDTISERVPSSNATHVGSIIAHKLGEY
jgi:hypothetical protein